MQKPIHVAELALVLHERDTIELRIEIEDGTVVIDEKIPTGYYRKGSVIEFQSLIERNRLVADYKYKLLRPRLENEPELLYEEAYQIWTKEIGHDDLASGRLLSKAADEFDIFSLGSQCIKSGENVFNVTSLVVAAIPYMGILNCESLINFCEAKYEQTKNDFDEGSVHVALEKWLGKHNAQAIELRSCVLSKLTDASASLLSNTVVAIAESDFVMAFDLARIDSDSDIPLRARVGAFTLGRLLMKENAPPEKYADVATILTNLIETKDGDLRVQAIRAATNAMHINSSFDVILKRLAIEGDKNVLSGVATTLFMRSSEMTTRGDIHEWLELMICVTPDMKGALNELDNALARLLTQPTNVTFIIGFLTRWTARYGRRVAIDKTLTEHFKDTINKLSKMSSVWPVLVTDWLLSASQEHAACLAGILTNLSDRDTSPIRLDKDQIDSLDSAGLFFLARRMLGYVYDRGQVTSMAISMLYSQNAKERIFPLVLNLLVDEIGYDYPGSTIDSCRTAAESCYHSEVKEFLISVADTIERTGKTINNLPRLNEIRPPNMLQRQFALARAKQMSDSFEDSRKKSVFRLFATEIPIKAGAGTFSYHNASYGNSVQLSSVSHSIEIPRREILDPVGYAIRGLAFRLAKRKV